MEKAQTSRLEHGDGGGEAEPDLRSGSRSRGAQEVAVQQRRRREEEEEKKKEEEEEPLLIHGLTVERYREIYNSVFTPSALAALSSAKQADYVSQALELKQRLWAALSRPRLVETVMEDGRVEVTEVMDLT